jgi:hypothetical protein
MEHADWIQGFDAAQARFLMVTAGYSHCAMGRKSDRRTLVDYESHAAAGCLLDPRLELGVIPARGRRRPIRILGGW